MKNISRGILHITQEPILPETILKGFLNTKGLRRVLANFNNHVIPVLDDVKTLTSDDILQLFHGDIEDPILIKTGEAFLKYASKFLDIHCTVIQKVEEIQGFQTSDISQEQVYEIMRILGENLGAHIEMIDFKGTKSKVVQKEDTIKFGSIGTLFDPQYTQDPIRVRITHALEAFKKHILPITMYGGKKHEAQVKDDYPLPETPDKDTIEGKLYLFFAREGICNVILGKDDLIHKLNDAGIQCTEETIDNTLGKLNQWYKTHRKSLFCIEKISPTQYIFGSQEDVTGAKKSISGASLVRDTVTALPEEQGQAPIVDKSIITPQELNSGALPGGKLRILLEANIGKVISFSQAMQVTGLKDQPKLLKAILNLNQKIFSATQSKIFKFSDANTKIPSHLVLCDKNDFERIQQNFLSSGSEVSGELLAPPVEEIAAFPLSNGAGGQGMDIAPVSEPPEIREKVIQDTTMYFEGEIFKAPDEKLRNICNAHKKYFNFEKKTFKEVSLSSDEFIFCVLAYSTQGFSSKDFLRDPSQSVTDMALMIIRASLKRKIDNDNKLFDIFGTKETGIFTLREKEKQDGKKSDKLKKLFLEKPGRILSKREIYEATGCDSEGSIHATLKYITGSDLDSERVIQLGSGGEFEGYFYGTEKELEKVRGMVNQSIGKPEGAPQEKIEKKVVVHKPTKEKIMEEILEKHPNITCYFAEQKFYIGNYSFSEDEFNIIAELILADGRYLRFPQTAVNVSQLAKEFNDNVGKQYRSLEIEIEKEDDGIWYCIPLEKHRSTGVVSKMSQTHKDFNAQIKSLANNNMYIGEYVSQSLDLLRKSNSLIITNYVVILFHLGNKKFKRIDTKDVSQLKHLLERVASGIIYSKDNLDAQAIGNALYGLQNLDITVVSKDLIDTLADKIRTSKDEDELSGQHIGNALYGLQNLDSTVVTRGFIEALTDKIRTSKDEDELSGQHIGNALYGLQNLDSTVVSRDLIDALTDKIRTSKDEDELSGQHIGNALYGLQNLDSTVVSRDFIDALTEKIRASKAKLDAQAIGNALYGLHYFSMNQETQESIESLKFYFLEKMKHLESSQLTQNDKNYLLHIQALYGLEETFTYVGNHTTSRTEQIFLTKLKKHYRGEIIVGKILGGVEMDVYLPELKINIEVDGEFHIGNKIFRDGKRDAFLKKNFGIDTIRIGIPGLQGEDIHFQNEQAIASILRFIPDMQKA